MQVDRPSKPVAWVAELVGVKRILMVGGVIVKLVIVWAEETSDGAVTAAYRLDDDPTVRRITLPAEKDATAWLNKAFPLIRTMTKRANPLVEELRALASSGTPISDDETGDETTERG